MQRHLPCQEAYLGIVVGPFEPVKQEGVGACVHAHWVAVELGIAWDSHRHDDVALALELNLHAAQPQGHVEPCMQEAALEDGAVHAQQNSCPAQLACRCSCRR